jgi:hypothetical protein
MTIVKTNKFIMSIHYKFILINKYIIITVILIKNGLSHKERFLSLYQCIFFKFSFPNIKIKRVFLICDMFFIVIKLFLKFVHRIIFG